MTGRRSISGSGSEGKYSQFYKQKNKLCLSTVSNTTVH